MLNRVEARAALAGLIVLFLVHLGARWWRSAQKETLPIIVPIVAQWTPFESSKKGYSYPKRKFNHQFFSNRRTTHSPLIFPEQGTLADSLTNKDWKNLGLSPKQIFWAEKIRKENGGFKKPEDLDHLFMLNEAQRESLKKVLAFPTMDSLEKWNDLEEPASNASNEKVQLNTADSLELLSVKGLGAYTVAQILRHRRTFGAFVSMGELHYLRGMQAERYEMLRRRLVCDTLPVKPISWQYLGRTQLLALPFVDWKLAKALLALRKRQSKRIPSKAQCIQAGMNDSTAMWFLEYLK